MTLTMTIKMKLKRSVKAKRTMYLHTFV